MKEQEEKVKFSEKFSLKMRKTFIVDKTLTILLVVVLIAAFIGLNLWVQSLDLPAIDVTENKIYTLSDASKKALQSVDQETKIYVFGIDEDDSVVELIKQYCAANEKITYEMLSSDSNLAKVQEFELEEGYSIIVLESGNSKKIIDASSDFYTYDQTTYATIDITEQTLTNSILNLSTENKPKVYFVEGHGEFSIGSDTNSTVELGVLSTYLQNEAFEVDSVNLSTTGTVPEDCDILAIVSPTSDFLEGETQAVIDYINKGGNLFITQDVVRISLDSQLTNMQKILDLYGVSFERGYVVEMDENNTLSSYPYIFRPQVSSASDVTADIASDSYMWLAYAEKLNFASDEEMKALNVTYEELLGTSDTALYITNLSASSATAAAESSQVGHFTVSAHMTKTISEGTSAEENTAENAEETPEEQETSDAIKSQLIITGTGTFCADYIISELSQNYPLSYLGSNKDFAINSIASLANKENGLKIRKDMSSSTYSPTEKQDKVVKVVIFSVPVIIMLVGIAIWKQRRKRK